MGVEDEKKGVVKRVEIKRLNPRQIEKAWTLYKRAFEQTARMTPRPQPLDLERFREIMVDPDFIKFFFAEKKSQPKAMLILTAVMEKVPFWINGEYLNTNYQDEVESGRMDYVVGILTDPDVRGKPQQYFRNILEVMDERMATGERILLQDFSPESAPNYPDIISRYYPDKYQYSQLDRQLHGTLDATAEIELESEDEKVIQSDSPEQEWLDKLYYLYEEYYAKINKTAVQPQSYSREFFLEMYSSQDYTKLIDFNDNGEPCGLAIVSKDLGSLGGILNEQFIKKKYGNVDFLVIIGLVGDDNTKKSLTKKICQLAHEQKRKIYFVGSENAMSDDLALLESFSGSELNYDGAQNYGVFSLVSAD